MTAATNSRRPLSRLLDLSGNRTHRGRQRHRPSSQFRPRLELLEDRLAPSLNNLGLLFEYADNNAIDDTPGTGTGASPAKSPAPDDWANIYKSISTPGDFDSALARAFVSDPPATDVSYFTGGGSKDVRDISDWLHQPGDVSPDKNDITDAYAAAYLVDTDGNAATPSDLIITFGADKFDASGSNQIGFWFFHQNIQLNNPTGSGGFSGVHEVGDLLILTDFTQGGRIGTVKVLEWVGGKNGDSGSFTVPTPGKGDGPLQLLNSSGNTSAVVNNTTTETAPWPYTDKDGNNNFAPNTFYEGAINVSALGLSGCFSSFMAESRSSGSSVNAQLKDLVLGTFELCNASGTSSLSRSKFDVETQTGDASFIDVGVTNTGALPLYLKSVTDTAGAQTSLGDLLAEQGTNPPGAVESVSSDLIHNGMIVGSATSGTKLDPGDQVIFHIIRTVQKTDPDPTTGSVTFTLTGNADLSGDPIPAVSTWTVNLFQPSATMTVTAAPTSAVAGTDITYTYTVTNTSSADSPNLVLDSTNQGPGDPNTFTDTLLGDLEADAIHAATGNSNATLASIAPGTSFSFTKTRTLQAGDPKPLTNSATAAFTLVQPTVGSFPNIIHASSSTTVHVVDASISIAPDDTNEVGQSHTFVVTVTQFIDGVSSAASGANVTVTLTDTNGAHAVKYDSVAFNLSGTADSNGQFAVTFTSATAGQIIGNATATLTVSGVALTRDTDPATGNIGAGPGGSGPATKTFVDARVTITPDDTNEVGQPHTFVVTVMQDDGLTAAQGGDGVTGFTAISGASVTVKLTGINGAVPDISAPSDLSPANPSTISGSTDSSGQFAVTFTSASAGQVIGNATASLTVGGVALTRDTDPATGNIGAGPGGSGPATKTFVDARVTISPDDTNGINEPHTFVVTVMQDDGLSAAQGGDGVTGFKAISGASVTVKLTGINGAVPDISAPSDLSPANPSTISGSTNSSGQFAVTFTSATAGQVIGNATASLTVGGVALTRDTDPATGNIGAGPGGSGPATKTFLDGTLRWLKKDNLGNLLGGATFLVTRTHTFNSATGQFDDTTDVIIGVGSPPRVTDDTDGTDGPAGAGLDQDGTPGELQLNHLVLGRYSIQETVAPSGYELDPNTYTVDLSVSNPSNADGTSGDIVPVFIDKPANRSQLVPTNTTCDQFAASTASTENVISYGAKSGKINNVSPGVLFYYTKVIAPTSGSSFVFHITQSITTGNFSTLFGIQSVSVFDASCATLPTSSFSVNVTGSPADLTITITGSVTAGQVFYANEKIDPGTVVGKTVPNPTSVTYHYATLIGGKEVSFADATLQKKGSPQLASSIGSGAGTAVLTDQLLQPVVAQAIARWRAAGVDPQQLRALEQAPLHIADITEGWLGLTDDGEIWIDRTAAGWGWSTASTPAAGRMDLLTVVTHEYGHILGLAPTETGVMEVTLTPGVRALPEPLPNSATIGVPSTAATGSVLSIGVPTPTATAVSRAAEPGDSPVRVPQTSLSRTETLDAVLATSLGGVKSETTTAAAQVGSPTRPVVVGAIQDGASVTPSLRRGLLNLGLGTFSLSSGTVDPEDLPAESDQDSSGILVPGLWPPLPRLDGNRMQAAERAAVWSANWGTAQLDTTTEAQADLGLRQQACDACFADGSWQAEPVAAAESVSAADAGAASAALAIVLGGYWSAPGAETQRRTRQRLLR